MTIYYVKMIENIGGLFMKHILKNGITIICNKYKCGDFCDYLSYEYGECTLFKKEIKEGRSCYFRCKECIKEFKN